MKAFIDASVAIAILTKESDWHLHADRTDQFRELLWSPVSRWESIIGYRRIRKSSTKEARDMVLRFGEDNALRMVFIGAAEADLADRALALFGRGSGSAAKLNMGDCFAYACAKANDAMLLYKGEDFDHTDMAWHNA